MGWNGSASRTRVTVEGEDREPLVAVVADPHCIGTEAVGPGKGVQARRLGALADDGNIGLQTQHRIELAMQSHAAIPCGKPHARFPTALKRGHDRPLLLTAQRQER